MLRLKSSSVLQRAKALSIGQAKGQWLEGQRRRARLNTIVSHEGAFAKLERHMRDFHDLPTLDVAEFPQITRLMVGEFMQ